MIEQFENAKVKKILTLPEDNDQSWKADLQKLINGDITLDRKTAGENSIKALQRLLIFMGYSTSFRGAYTIDGDFGRGTNRGLAQFKFENGLKTSFDRSVLCYPCKASNAHKLITKIPDVKLTLASLKKMIEIIQAAIVSNQVMCGSFKEAIFHLNNTQQRSLLTCRKILEHYGDMARDAVNEIKSTTGLDIEVKWLLAIIKQETGGVIRPRFEQHLLSSYNSKQPDVAFSELRLRATSFGLGQILGVNYKMVGAPSAQSMFFSSPKEQVVHIARFLIKRSINTKKVVQKSKPVDQDFRTIARYYNGPKYEEHHYHERLARWYKEFQSLMQP